jgi:hypothetical protein
MPIGNNAYPVHKGVTKKGYPTHVPNGDGGTFGDPYSKGIDDGAVSVRPRVGVLNQEPESSWKYPAPTKGRR